LIAINPLARGQYFRSDREWCDLQQTARQIFLLRIKAGRIDKAKTADCQKSMWRVDHRAARGAGIKGEQGAGFIESI
jgi:hypothetical protein